MIGFFLRITGSPGVSKFSFNVRDPPSLWE